MSRIPAIGLVLLLLLGCNTGSSLKKVDPYIFLHDNSSKIWLVDKLLIGTRDYTPLRFSHRQIIAFHESGNAYFYRLHEFGDKPGQKAIYWMNREKDEFGFQLSDKEWLFRIQTLSRKRVVLKPKNDSYPYTIVLVPFPEY